MIFQITHNHSKRYFQKPSPPPHEGKPTYHSRKATQCLVYQFSKKYQTMLCPLFSKGLDKAVRAKMRLLITEQLHNLVCRAFSKANGKTAPGLNCSEESGIPCIEHAQ